MICSRFTAEWSENKVYFFRRSLRVWLLVDQEMTFAKHSQVIVNVLWSRHPVSLLKQVSNFPTLHPWIWWTTFKEKRKKKERKWKPCTTEYTRLVLGDKCITTQKIWKQHQQQNTYAVNWYDSHITITTKRTSSLQNIHLSSIHKKRWLVFISKLSITKESSRVFMLKINIYLW